MNGLLSSWEEWFKLTEVSKGDKIIENANIYSRFVKPIPYDVN